MRRKLTVHFLLALAATAQLAAQPPARRPRAAEIGIPSGTLPRGVLDAITDVAGVRVGHTTLVRGDDVRTGVTVILPHSVDSGDCRYALLFVSQRYQGIDRRGAAGRQPTCDDGCAQKHRRR